jgi:hypothetical protein
MFILTQNIIIAVVSVVVIASLPLYELSCFKQSTDLAVVVEKGVKANSNDTSIITTISMYNISNTKRLTISKIELIDSVCHNTIDEYFPENPVTIEPRKTDQLTTRLVGKTYGEYYLLASAKVENLDPVNKKISNEKYRSNDIILLNEN